eukprot:4292188-Heterocapsa_arctica.AAC.1
MERPNKRAKREAENFAAIGGMRHPHLACARIPGWQPAGERLRNILEPILAKHAVAAAKAISTIGQQGHQGLP